MQNDSSPPPDPRDDLAGIYVEIATEELLFLPPDGGEPRSQREPGWTSPTTDEMAGVTITIEAEEKVYLPPSPPAGSAPAAEKKPA